MPLSKLFLFFARSTKKCERRVRIEIKKEKNIFLENMKRKIKVVKKTKKECKKRPFLLFNFNLNTMSV